jgi:predicted DCC family thiol-disulfide oxidoreductase YuxK
MKTFLDKMLFKKIDATGLAIFRIFYSLVLYCEVSQIYKYQNIIYPACDELNMDFIFKFWIPVIILMTIGLFTRIATIINYLFSVIIFSSAHDFEYHVFYAFVGMNFLLIFMPISRVFSLDNLLIKLKHSSPQKLYLPDTKVLAVNYIAPVFVAIGIVYFDSVLFKLSSPMWLKGLGMWLPSSLPIAVWNDITWLNNNELLVKFMGYFTIVFEAIFIFIFWKKKYRIPLLLIGLLLHIGILIAFPIPWFALTAIVVYILMVPVGFWNQLKKRISSSQIGAYTFFYDKECPLCTKVVVVINHFDILNRIKCIPVQNNYQNYSALTAISLDDLLINIHGINSKEQVFVGYNAYVELLKSMIYTWPLGFILSLPGFSTLGTKVYKYIAGNRITERCTLESCPMPVLNNPVSETQDYFVKGLNQVSITKYFWISFISIVLFFQFFISWQSKLSQMILWKIGLGNSQIDATMRNVGTETNPFALHYLGLTQHPVFMDNHFADYNHIFKVELVKEDKTQEILPIINNNGMPGSYIRGAFWVNYTFRTSSPHFSVKQFEKGIVKYINYYIKEKSLDKQNLAFIVYIKDMEMPKDWEKDFMHKQMEKPWQEAGQYYIDSNGNGYFKWNTSMYEIN